MYLELSLLSSHILLLNSVRKDSEKSLTRLQAGYSFLAAWMMNQDWSSSRTRRSLKTITLSQPFQLFSPSQHLFIDSVTETQIYVHSRVGVRSSCSWTDPLLNCNMSCWWSSSWWSQYPFGILETSFESNNINVTESFMNDSIYCLTWTSLWPGSLKFLTRSNTVWIFRFFWCGIACTVRRNQCQSTI